MSASDPRHPNADPGPDAVVVDDDMAEQARPGYGIPSQDPRPGAQYPLTPEAAEREARSVVVGGGAIAGAATGAAIGTAVAGPVGVVVGGTLGLVAGALGGAAAGTMIDVKDAAEETQATQAPNPVHLHVEDSGGSGRPVVLIHGWPLSAAAWQPQLAALAKAGHRVVAYDRRGFGRSDKPDGDYGYDTLADDLRRVLDQCGLQDVTLVGFSMGGGEVARYVARHGEARLRGVVFAAAVPPYLLKTADNPEGPLAPDQAQQMKQGLERDRSAFFDQFTRDFFSAHGKLRVTEAQRSEAIVLCQQSDPQAALACIDSFAATDFRADLGRITVPTLVIHGDADAIVPIEGSGRRTHLAIAHSRLVVVEGGPHGLNASHAQAFNEALLAFLQ
ncbi:MAG: alpha/beta hydrolase [Rubrivivax sp.]